VDSQHLQVAFFDIGNTLGSVRLSSRQPHRLERLDLYPQVSGVLQELRRSGVRLGIVSNIGQESEEHVRRVLEEGQIYDLFEPNLLIYGEKNSPEIFSHAAEQAENAATPERCLYVGEDRDERSYALEAGFRVAPHPRLAMEVLNGKHLRYVRVTVPAKDRSSGGWREAIGDLAVVPMHVTGESGSTVYAIATSEAASRLDDLGFEVLRLGSEDLPLATEVYFLRDDRQTRTGFLVEEGESSRFFDSDEHSQMVLASSEGGLYVALPAGHSVEQYHFEGALHGHNLKLTPGLVLLEPTQVTRTANLLSAPPVESVLSQEEIEALRAEITPESIAADVDRYGGNKQHEHNALAVAALQRGLERIGGEDFVVALHHFTHRGRHLDNVEAELVGSELEEIVLITAHLDSTAAFTPPPGSYNPPEDPAPGVDDDGSGTVAVLAAARAIKRLSALKQPKRTIRFVLFNAEEHGLVGSDAYALDEAALTAPIVAVYQMDMIGFNREPPRTYEVHSGIRQLPDVEKGSRVLAERIGRLAAHVSPGLRTPEIYDSEGPEENGDPAERRSDHYSFQVVGYPACVATEDLFPGISEPGTSDSNPNYHQVTDTEIDTEYAADIARAVGAAAWATANM
jgi:bacterial leucyl aminopeptidase